MHKSKVFLPVRKRFLVFLTISVFCTKTTRLYQGNNILKK